MDRTNNSNSCVDGVVSNYSANSSSERIEFPDEVMNFFSGSSKGINRTCPVGLFNIAYSHDYGSPEGQKTLAHKIGIGFGAAMGLGVDLTFLIYPCSKLIEYLSK